MTHLAPSDDINVLAPPSSLQMRKCTNSPPNAHTSSHNKDSNKISKHRPRLTSHKAIMRLQSLHSMGRECKEQARSVEQEVLTRQNLKPRTNADSSIPSDNASCDLLFTPPGRSSYLPGSTPQSVGLDIDATSDIRLPLSPRQVASTPPRVHHRHPTPFTVQHENVDHLCIDNVFDRPQLFSHQNSATPITVRPFVLRMKRSVADDH